MQVKRSLLFPCTVNVFSTFISVILSADYAPLLETCRGMD